MKQPQHIHAHANALSNARLLEIVYARADGQLRSEMHSARCEFVAEYFFVQNCDGDTEWQALHVACWPLSTCRQQRCVG